ncbi:MAG: DUF1475 family protein [Candidatus Sumerlaeia bacterium]|nr:DUF1475 family protein [Candidatus Sumerlaeia bacterium]
MSPAKIAKTAAVLMLLGMAAFFVHAGMAADTGFFEGFGALMEDKWFQATLFDFYVGIALFALWVAYRERSPFLTAAWTVSFVLLGNLSTLVYLLLVLRGVRTREELGRALLGRGAA